MNAPAQQNTPESVFIHIIESPAANDLFDGRTEGGTLREALRVAGIKSWYRLASSTATFDRALTSDLAAAMAYYNGVPLLHISAHGNQDGIGLTDGSFLTWQELRDRLVPVNAALGGFLLLSMSSCMGAAGCRMAMYEAQPLPFHTVVGHFGSPTWADAAIAFVAFYHRIFKFSCSGWCRMRPINGIKSEMSA